jgi:hypothetical protein
METFRDGDQSCMRPGSQGAPARPGQSGEGSRSALEHLIQQEKKRDAQLPRDAGSVGGDAGTSA